MLKKTHLSRAVLTKAAGILLGIASAAAPLAAQEEPTDSIEAAVAGEHVGERVTVCGPVASARYLSDVDGKPTFLNLDHPYPDQSLVVVIPALLREALGRPEENLVGVRLCATGVVEELSQPPGLLRIVLKAAEDLAVEEHRGAPGPE